MQIQAQALVPGRECGTCTMCCKLYDIKALGKTEGVWCKHCAIGHGCQIYDDRPSECRGFFCLYRTDPSVPEIWKPDRSKLAMSIFPDNGFIYVQVDPGSPQAWRKEPYFSALKGWSQKLLPQGRHIIVFVNRIATLIMPTGPVPIGPMTPQDGFMIKERFTATGKTYEAQRVPRGGQ